MIKPQFAFNITDEEMRQLNQLAHNAGVSKATIVRRALHQFFAYNSMRHKEEEDKKAAMSDH